jgi:hypothetical protein
MSAAIASRPREPVGNSKPLAFTIDRGYAAAKGTKSSKIMPARIPCDIALYLSPVDVSALRRTCKPTASMVTSEYAKALNYLNELKQGRDVSKVKFRYMLLHLGEPILNDKLSQKAISEALDRMCPSIDNKITFLGSIPTSIHLIKELKHSSAITKDQLESVLQLFLECPRKEKDKSLKLSLNLDHFNEDLNEMNPVYNVTVKEFVLFNPIVGDLVRFPEVPNLNTLEEIFYENIMVPTENRESFAALLSKCPNVKTLKLENTPFRLSEVIDRMPTLRGLKTIEVTDSVYDYESFAALLSKCPNVETLKFKSIPFRLSRVIDRMSALTSLKTIEVTDSVYDYESFAALLSKCPNVETLKLKDIYFISSREIDRMPTLRSLKTIEITCDYCDKKSIAALLSKCPNVQTLIENGSVVSRTRVRVLGHISRNEMRYFVLTYLLLFAMLVAILPKEIF